MSHTYVALMSKVCGALPVVVLIIKYFFMV